jgi:Uma2 family endonuclease
MIAAAYSPDGQYIVTGGIDLVLRDASTLPDLESMRPLDRVLLAAEVISASSVRADRQVKPRACALAGIPLYLLVDRFTRPVTISLHSEPGVNGYAKVNTVTAGEKLRIPAPFGLTLDTSSLPLPE